jgi:four helix bundle protein
MNADEFKARTKKLALRIGKLADALPQSRSADIYGRQLIRSSSSVGANYRAVCRAKSQADMINKLKIVEEEADETLYWLEIIIESGLLPENRVSDLMKETDEILSMVVASLRTLRKKQTNRQSN